MKSESEVLEVKGSVDTNTLDASDKSSFNVLGYLKHLTHKYVAILVFFILWQILPSLNPTWAIFIPTPTTIAETIWGLILSGELINDIWVSMWRVLIAFALSLIVGLSLGFLLGGFFRNAEKALSPLLDMISQANPFTLLPVFIAFLGIGVVS